MDDLLGEDWQSSSKQPTLTPTIPTTFTPSYNNLRTTSQPSSSAPSPYNLSRPSSTAPNGQSKLPTAKPKSNADAFGSLTGFKTFKSNGPALSLQERQRQLAEEKQKQAQEHGKLWDSLGAASKEGSFTARSPVEDEEDILAAFNKDVKVDRSSHFPPPSLPASEPVSGVGTPANAQQASSSGAFEDDDDTFGLMSITKSNGHVITGSTAALNGDDDILGDLSRPVAARPTPVQRKQSSDSSDAGWDENIATGRSKSTAQPQDSTLSELIEMGFPEDTAKIALAENGGDVQRSVGWLLQQAHEESKQKLKEQRNGGISPSRSGRSPVRRPQTDAPVPNWMKEESRSGSSSRQRERAGQNEKDATQIAQEFGSKLFKSANSLWKTGQKQIAKTVADFQQEREPNQPRWMQQTSSSTTSRDSSQPRPSKPQQPSLAQSSHTTDEAALLDMPREASIRPAKMAATRPTSEFSRDSSPAAQLRREAQTPVRLSPQSTIQDRRPASKLSRQEVEEQSAQAYVSPARRRKTASKTETVVQPAEPEVDLFSMAAVKATPTSQPAEPEVDLFSPAPVRPTPSAGKLAKPAHISPAITPRPQVSARNTPFVTPAALSTSSRQRKLGTDAFKRGDYGAAHEAYTAAILPLPSMHPALIVVLTNRSLTALKTGDAKTAVSDADRALEIIGPGLGLGEVIEIGDESSKDMREFYGKALMRKAEALEHMEKWNDAADVWRIAVESGIGGAISLRGKDRCEKAVIPAAAKKPVVNGAAKTKVTPARPAKTVPKSAATTQSSHEAVKKLREANAAAEKADDEKFQLADKVDAKLVAWKGGKADNLRALLQSLDIILWESAGWKKVGMSDLVMPNKVKIAYMKAIAKVHPDKISQEANTEQRMISAAVFSTLNEAWDKFKKDNNL